MRKIGGGATDYLCIGEHQHLSTSVLTPVAADLTKSIHDITTATDKAGVEQITLGDGTTVGERHFFTRITVGAIHAPDVAVYPTNIKLGTHVHLGDGTNGTIGDYLGLMWDGADWVILTGENEYA